MRWLRSKENVAAVPKATSEDHLRTNLNALEGGLDDEAVATIESIDDRFRLIDCDYAPWR